MRAMNDLEIRQHDRHALREGYGPAVRRFEIASILAYALAMGWLLIDIAPRIGTNPFLALSALMLGFVATYAGGEPAPHDDELEDARWFGCDELIEFREGRGNGIHLPPPIAIARRLIDGWLDATDDLQGAA